ncbi:MAG: metal-dependent hydrolase [Gemmatimonadaceae bacterium]
MDNVTHALAGCLLAAGTVTIAEHRGFELPRSFRAIASAVGIITAELPDVDLVYAGSMLGMGKLGYLLHHRGHTHTVLFAVTSALLVWLATLAFRRETRTLPIRNVLLVLALLGTGSHLALDYTNNYGVHPFWPLVNRWFYGDAVFIVEPWFWIVAIPPLYLFYRGRVPRSVLGFLLITILVASWLLGMVGGGVAAALTAATFAWMQCLRVVRGERRIAYGVGAWLAVETVFGVASAQARAAVQASVGTHTFRDVSLTPLIGNPLCYRALVVEVDGPTYRVTNAMIAPFNRVRNAAACVSQGEDNLLSGSAFGSTLSAHVSNESVRWDNEWSAPLSDLQHIVSTHCEAAAAMEFMRVPVWSELKNGDVEIRDARFGTGARGFASLTASAHPRQCPRFLPGWTPPRNDLLRQEAFGAPRDWIGGIEGEDYTRVNKAAEYE